METSVEIIVLVLFIAFVALTEFGSELMLPFAEPLNWLAKRLGLQGDGTPGAEFVGKEAVVETPFVCEGREVARTG